MPKDNSFKKDQGEIVIYQTEDGKTKIDVRFIDETVWLTQQQLGELFQSSRSYNERADAEKPFMGFTAFSGGFPTAMEK